MCFLKPQTNNSQRTLLDLALIPVGLQKTVNSLCLRQDVWIHDLKAGRSETKQLKETGHVKCRCFNSSSTSTCALFKAELNKILEP